MKIKIKALELIEKGIPSKTVLKLSESEINLLHSKLLGEQTKAAMVQIKSTTPNAIQTVKNLTTQGVPVQMIEKELEEEEEVTMDPNQKKQTQDPEQEGPSSNDGFGPDKTEDPSMNDDGMYNFESIEESKKKKEKNPWAICTAKMGEEFGTSERSEWTKKQKAKYESCVMGVKKSLEESKKNVSLFLETEIQKIVERHLSPKITKRELMKYLGESEPAVAPTKPATPTKPKPRPMRPGQNPNPGEKEAPMAVEPEKAKKKVISTIMKMLRKK